MPEYKKLLGRGIPPLVAICFAAMTSMALAGGGLCILVIGSQKLYCWGCRPEQKGLVVGDVKPETPSNQVNCSPPLGSVANG